MRSVTRRNCGFTLLEIATVVVIIGVLAVLLLPAIARVKQRAQRVRCIANLRSLHSGAALHIQEHESWPQIDMETLSEDEYTAAWLASLQPYGIGPAGWICPSLQHLADEETEAPQRDYEPGSFPRGRMYPYKWTTQPWFIENASMHGRQGNYIVFPDGSVKPLSEIVR